MGKPYQHLQKPLKIGSVVLKNRLLSSNALPHFLSGPEPFPSEEIIQYQARIAKNGAAIVTTMDWSDSRQRNGPGDSCHFPMFNLEDPAVQNYMNQLADAIHFYHSKASVAIMHLPPKGYGVMDAEHGPFWPNELPDEPLPPMPAPDDDDMPGGMPLAPPCTAMGEEQMQELIQKCVNTAKLYQSFGFDMITIHMSYQATILAQFLSPMTNRRQDQYGGSVENRARFPLMLCKAMKDACGKDFLIEAQVSGEESPGGISLQDTVEFAKLAEGIIDILQLRAGDGTANHPTGFNSTEVPLTIRYAQAVKESGAKIITAPIGGFQDPAQADQFIAEGKTDMVAAARAFFCDPDYYQKIKEGRGDDVVPCIRCNRCHGQGMDGPWISICSVNPTLGYENRLKKMVDPKPAKIKRVAVIGGGPACMNAAIVAASRGHDVTLFEKTGRLGGQLIHADYADFKWPIRKYKEYQVRQLDRLGVKVCLNCAPTPEELAIHHFDSVIAATGAVPKIPPVEGIPSRLPDADFRITDPISVYGNEEKLGRKVIIIGGSETGTETGLYLARCGHDVTVLTRSGRLAKEADRVHYYEAFRDAWEAESRFSYLTHARTLYVTETDDGCLRVRFAGKDGRTSEIFSDSVVACGGMQPLTDAALSYADCGLEFAMAGDCEKIGNIQKAVKSSYTAAVVL